MGHDGDGIFCLVPRLNINQRRRQSVAEGAGPLLSGDGRPCLTPLVRLPDLWVEDLDLAPDDAVQSTEIILA
jgi:hypothetical protein